MTLQDDNLIDPLDQHYSITVAVKALNQTQQEPNEEDLPKTNDTQAAQESNIDEEKGLSESEIEPPHEQDEPKDDPNVQIYEPP